MDWWQLNIKNPDLSRATNKNNGRGQQISLVSWWCWMIYLTIRPPLSLLSPQQFTDPTHSIRQYQPKQAGVISIAYLMWFLKCDICHNATEDPCWGNRSNAFFMRKVTVRRLLRTQTVTLVCFWQTVMMTNANIPLLCHACNIYLMQRYFFCFEVLSPRLSPWHLPCLQLQRL